MDKEINPKHLCLAEFYKESENNKFEKQSNVVYEVTL